MKFHHKMGMGLITSLLFCEKEKIKNKKSNNHISNYYDIQGILHENPIHVGHVWGVVMRYKGHDNLDFMDGLLS